MNKRKMMESNNGHVAPLSNLGPMAFLESKGQGAGEVTGNLKERGLYRTGLCERTSDLWSSTSRFSWYIQVLFKFFPMFKAIYMLIARFFITMDTYIMQLN